MSDLQKLAELWEQYSAAWSDISTREPVRNLHLRKEDGGDEFLFLSPDGSPLDEEDGWRQITRSSDDVALQIRAVQSPEHCLAILSAALRAYEQRISVGLLMPEAIEAITRHLTSAGHTDTAVVSMWESYGPVQPHETKGA